MVYLMNSAVMPAERYGLYRYSPATLEDLRSVVTGQHGPWKSAIGYPQNCDLIERWTGIRPPLQRIEVLLQTGDRALVMRLRQRVANPATKGMPVSEDPSDWELAWVDYQGATEGGDEDGGC